MNTRQPSPSPASMAVRDRMRAQMRSGTRPEKLLRSALHRKGHRFRVGLRVPGAPRRTIDIAFTRDRIAVFVDGCFWHRCPMHAAPVRTNGAWWDAKLAANVARDRDTDRTLTAAGWTVVRVWEHEPVETAVARVEEARAAVARVDSDRPS